MYRYALVTVAIFAIAYADLGSSQEEKGVELEETTPIPLATPSFNDSDTDEVPHKSPLEIQLILPPGMNKEHNRYGSQGPGPNMGRPNDGSYGGSDETGVYGWRITGMGGSVGGPNQYGGPYGPSKSMGPGSYGQPGPMGPNGWQGPMGGYGGRGSRRGGRRNGRRGGRRGGPCGPNGLCPYGETAGYNGYGGSFGMGGYGYGGYGRGNRQGQGYGGF